MKKAPASLLGKQVLLAFEGGASADAEGGYPQSCAWRMTAPSAEGAFWGPRLRTRKEYPQSAFG